MVAVARPMLGEQVKDILLERILRGELAAGEPLVETRIAAEFGVSQAPVREALRHLQAMRLVVSEPFKTARVRAVTDRDLLDTFPVRAVLEELAARELARLPERDVSVLEREIDGMREAAAAGDTRAQLAHDIAFHRAIVEQVGNHALVQAWLALGVEAATAFGVYWTYFDPYEIAEFHVPIVGAIGHGDPARAAAEARRHVKRTQRVVRARHRERALRLPEQPSAGAGA